MYIDRNIEDIIEKNSMDYSQYVIKNRALPDLYSGMKPIHLKILWSMFENKTFTYTKSANVSGKVMVYSPHGDCYETIVNMVQKDRHIYNLIEGQGNWGSSCSTEMKYGASRYTECKMSVLGIDCMQGISKNMVEMIDNYDSSSKMPKYLPTRFPLILCMASSGIAVGMANNSISFEIEDVCNATISHLKGEEIPMLIPEFATGGYVLNDVKEIQNVNLTGRGNITLRAKYKIEGNIITISEIPYGVKVTVESIIDRVIEKCKKGELKEVTNILNQTGIDGLSIEITCKKGIDMEKLMNKLYALTPLESNFSANMNVLVEGRPMVLGVYDTIKEWTKFRQKCMVRGLQFSIDKLQEELHLLRGFKKVLLDIDKAIEIIRHSDNVESKLMEYFKIDEIQTNSIINMKLRNINKAYIIKQISEIKNMEIELENLKLTIDNPTEIKKLIIEDLKDVIKKFKQPRRTTIIEKEAIQDVTKVDLISEYNCRISLTEHGYIKKTLKTIDTNYIKEGDLVIKDNISSTNKSDLLLFTDKANRYKIPCYELATCNNPSKALGEFLPNILSLEKDENILNILSFENNKKAKGYILSVYENGKIAKIDIDSFISANTKLQNCYNTNSKIIITNYIEEDCDVLMISEEGKSLIINTKLIGSKQTKNSQGNTAMKLGELEDNKLVFAMINPNEDLKITLKTKKNKEKIFQLNNLVESNKTDEERNLYTYLTGRNGTQGSFLINTRTNDDKVISVDIIVNN